MASTVLAERTYKLLREYFLEQDVMNNNDFWKKEIALGNHSNIFINHHLRNSTTEARLFVLMVDCMEDIRQAEAKANGIKSIDKIMNKTCKENAKRYGNYHPLIGGYMDDEGYQYVSNSYYGLKTDKPVNLPPVPSSTTFPQGIIDIINSQKEKCDKLIPCPSLSSVKSHIRLSKAELPKGVAVHYKFIDAGNDNSTWVDAEYLARVIEFLGDNNIHCYTTSEEIYQKTTAMYFTNEHGEEAVLCPVKKY